MKFQSICNRFDPIPVRLSRSSKTVPDMSYTPRQIIAKFSRGEKVPLGFKGIYDSEDEQDKLFTHDPAIFEDDPTRDLGFDFGDYVEEKHALKERERQRLAERSNPKEAQKPKRKASAEDMSASDLTKRATTSEGSGLPPSGQSSDF